MEELHRKTHRVQIVLEKIVFAGSDIVDDQDEVDDRPEFVFEEQLADQTREQLLHILGYQYCAEKM